MGSNTSLVQAGIFGLLFSTSITSANVTYGIQADIENISLSNPPISPVHNAENWRERALSDMNYKAHPNNVSKEQLLIINNFIHKVADESHSLPPDIAKIISGNLDHLI